MCELVANEIQMMSPEDIANRMCVSRRTVLRWIERGTLAAYRIGGITRIDPEDFEGFLRRHNTSASSISSVKIPIAEG